MHTTEVTLIGNQLITFNNKTINLHAIRTIVIDSKGKIVNIYLYTETYDEPISMLPNDIL